MLDQRHGRPETCGRPGQANNLATRKNQYSSNPLGLGECWKILLNARAQIADNFRIFAYGNLSLIAPHFDINDVLAPRTGCRPLQLLGCPAPDHFANSTAELQLQTPDRPRSPFYSTTDGMDAGENKTLHPIPEGNHPILRPSKPHPSHYTQLSGR
jgi:hypothetical protein